MNANCEYPVQWSATNLIGPDMDLLIDLYFSRDSGASWLSQFATNTENDGIFWWKIPYDSNYITSHGRIKAVATHKDYSFLTDWDMSDADFCPPMLTLEEIMYLEEAELLELAGLSENPVLEQAPEIVPEEEPGEEIVGDFQEETLSEEIEGTPEEIPPEEEITEESVNVTTNDSSPENAVTTEETIEENPSGEELPQEIIEETEEVIEESVIEEAPPEDTPAIEEEQVTIPDDNPGQEQNPEEGSGDGGESGENVSE